jgi:F-type H+-transporting ATPase subunit b
LFAPTEGVDVLTAVVVRHGASSFEVHLIAQDEGDEEAPSEEEAGEGGTEAEDEGPSPIAPELKELAWGGGAFVVFLIAMRLFLFPRVKRGMEARYAKIRGDHEAAENMKTSAERDVAEYEQALAGVRAEASGRIDAARQTLEGERTARLDDVNAGIAERRSAAADEAAAAREAARGSIESAVVGVAARASELATGRRPDDAEVQRVVADVMSVGAGR